VVRMTFLYSAAICLSKRPRNFSSFLDFPLGGIHVLLGLAPGSADFSDASASLRYASMRCCEVTMSPSQVQSGRSLLLLQTSEDFP